RGIGEALDEGSNMWDKASLHDLIRTKLTDYQMIVVANREPYQHRYTGEDDAIEWIRPASGMAAALDPVMRASGGVWVAHGSADVRLHPGLPLRPAAPIPQGAQSEPDRRTVLAHPLAESGGVPRLPLEGGAAHRPARQRPPGLPAQVPLPELHGHRGPHARSP